MRLKRRSLGVSDRAWLAAAEGIGGGAGLLLLALRGGLRLFDGVDGGAGSGGAGRTMPSTAARRARSAGVRSLLGIPGITPDHRARFRQEPGRLLGHNALRTNSLY